MPDMPHKLGKPFRRVYILTAMFLALLVVYLLGMGPIARSVVLTAEEGDLERLAEERRFYHTVYGPVLKIRALNEGFNHICDNYEMLWIPPDWPDRVDAACQVFPYQTAEHFIGEDHVDPSEWMGTSCNLTRAYERLDLLNSFKDPDTYVLLLVGSQEVVATTPVRSVGMVPILNFFCRKRTAIDVLPKRAKLQLPTFQDSTELLKKHLEEVETRPLDWKEQPLDQVARWIEEEASRGLPEAGRVRVEIKLENSDKRTITLRLNSVRLKDALRVFCYFSGSEVKLDGNRIIIRTPTGE